MESTITVLGAGYVGLTTAALLSNSGYTVYVVEPNPERLSVIKQGRSFFYEEGLDAVIAKGLSDGTLLPTDSYEDSVPNSSVIFSCVGTPDNPDGSSNLTYVFSAAESAARLAQPGTVYAQKSTVPVGTGERVEALYESLEAELHYVSNPEFLREGTALSDTLFFDRVVAGGKDQSAVDAIVSIYKALEAAREEIAQTAGVKLLKRDGEYITTSLNSAELIKVTSNAFLALKISFANSIAKLADKAGADVVEVMNAVGADSRINRAFFNAGRGYGGGCFPKDVSGLIASGLSYGVDLELVTATKSVNDSMPGYLTEKLQEAMDGKLVGARVAVLGLAFKAGTSDTRKSPGVYLANILAERGCEVYAYDPQAMQEASHELVSEVHLTKSLNKCLSRADAVIIATDWPEFKTLSPSDVSADVIVDGYNTLDKAAFLAAGIKYVGIGR